MDDRITELEIKLSYLEDTVDEHNRVIFRQQQQIEFLIGEFRALQEQVRHQPNQEHRSLRDEIPPHY
ncbi:SlyX family protein [Dechloromonas sp. ZY10]|uniref:SlyX family protein n=1 Tax=Dechloromonas aquae TaxID=2664436 RepID=UPI0035278CF7